MGSPVVSLAVLYRQAYRAGEQMLQLLERELDEVVAAELENLLAERGRLAAQAEERLAAGERSDEALIELRELIRQQEALEAATNLRMVALRTQLGAAFRSKGLLGSTSRLLGPRVRSHWLDAYR